MLADQKRMPDLWLKRQLALAVLPPGKRSDRLSHEILAECVCGRAKSSSTLNHLLAGDEAIRSHDELRWLAAALEYVVLHGTPQGFGPEVVRQFASERGQLKLWPDAIGGTFGDFAVGLLDVLAEREDYSRSGPTPFQLLMARSVDQQFQDMMEQTTDLADTIHLLHGRTRDWALSASADERIIRQPALEIPTIREGEFVQLVLPPSQQDQLVFGLEIRTDVQVVIDPWSSVGGWFEPRLQRAGEAIALLTEPDDPAMSPRAEAPGAFLIQVVAVAHTGHAETPKLPPALQAMIDGSPAHWPRGYAPAMATLTYVKRRADKHKKAANKRDREDRDLEPLPGGQDPLPDRARRYSVRYKVVAA